jgi:hypothetical protein
MTCVVLVVPKYADHLRRCQSVELSVDDLRTGPALVDPAVGRARGAPEGTSQLAGGNWFPPALFALIVLGGVLLATGVIFDDDDDTPFSP